MISSLFLSSGIGKKKGGKLAAKAKGAKKADATPKPVVITQSEILRRDGIICLPIKMSKLFAGKYCNWYFQLSLHLIRLPSQATSSMWQVDKESIGLSRVQQFYHLCITRSYLISVNSIFFCKLFQSISVIHVLISLYLPLLKFLYCFLYVFPVFTFILRWVWL